MELRSCCILHWYLQLPIHFGLYYIAYNDVSKIAIFGFVNPLCSVILSALVLGEVKQAFNIGSLIALALVCVGIYIVNAKKNNKSNVE